MASKWATRAAVPGVEAPRLPEDGEGLALPVEDITAEVLDYFMGEGRWRSRSHKHLTFQGEAFNLASLDGLLRQPLDLSALESLDVSNNSLGDLACVEGTSTSLTKESQGAPRLQSLRVLKARHNRLAKFAAVLPVLRELDLGHNALVELPPLIGLPRLEVLVLSHNKMEGSWATLAQLPQLRKLDLADNKFDARPSLLQGVLRPLEGLKRLTSLRIQDNPLTYYFPEYQPFVLAQLPTLERLDDVPDVAEARRAVSASSSERSAALDRYDAIVIERMQRAHARPPSARAEVHVGSGSSSMPATFEEGLVAPVEEALQDPRKMQQAVEQLARNCARLAEDPSRLHLIWREAAPRRAREADPLGIEVDAKVCRWVGNCQLLLDRFQDDEPARRMLVRSIAKLAALAPEHSLGSRCLGLLAALLSGGPRAEAEMLPAVHEMFVEPLSIAIPDMRIVGRFIRCLVRLKCPGLAAALAPAAQKLARLYCLQTPPDKNVVVLLTIALQCPEGVQRAMSEEDFPGRVAVVLEQELGLQDESRRGELLDHLLIVSRTAPCGGPAAACYEERELHRTLARALVFKLQPEQPRDRSRGPSGHLGASADWEADLSRLSTSEATIAAAVIDALAGLAAGGSGRLLAELTSQDEEAISQHLVLAPKANPLPAPCLVAASLRALLVLLRRSYEQAAGLPKDLVVYIVKEHDCLKPLLELLDASSRRYKQLWTAALKQAAESGEALLGAASAISSEQAPRLASLRHPLVLGCMEAALGILDFFAEAARSNPMCREVSAAMHTQERDRLLFKLLEVPGGGVKAAAMQCLQKVEFGELSPEEVLQLIQLLESAGSRSMEGTEPVLEKVVLHLRSLSACPGVRGGAQALQSERAEQAVAAVTGGLLHALRPEASHAPLASACVAFLQTAGRVRSMRQPAMRSKPHCESLIEALKLEERAQGRLPDIPTERTWGCRSVETLLQCLTGPGHLQARSKVAFRVVARLADVLEGRSDQLAIAGPAPQAFGGSSPQHSAQEGSQPALATRLADEERGMWDESRMRRGLHYLDDIELGDRASQQRLFAQEGRGVDRLAQFLLGLLGPEGNASKAMADLQRARQFLDQAKASALSAAEEALHQQPRHAGSSSLPRGEHRSGTQARSGRDGVARGQESEGEDDEERPDRRLLLEALLPRAAAAEGREPVMQPLLLRPVGQPPGSCEELQEEAALLVDPASGRTQPSFVVAAALRCLHATLRLPASKSVRASTAAALRDGRSLGLWLSIVRACGSPFCCCIAAKLLRVASDALELPPSQADEEVDRVPVYDVLASFYNDLAPVAERAASVEDPILAARGRMLCAEIAHSAAVVSRNVMLCRVSDRRPQQARFVEICLERLVPLAVVQAVLQLPLAHPALAQRRDGARLDEDEALENARAVLAALLDHCPRAKYGVLEVFARVLTNGADARTPFVASLLGRSTADRTDLERFFARQQDDLSRSRADTTATRSGSERVLACARVEAFYAGDRVRTQGGGLGLLCAATSRAFYLLDAAAPGREETPRIVQTWAYSDMTRIVKGATAQDLHIGWGVRAKNGPAGEEILSMVFHRGEERGELMMRLHALSVAAGGGLQRLPLQPDVHLKRDLAACVVEGHVLATFAETLHGNLALFVLSESRLYEVDVAFPSWVPPRGGEELDLGAAGTAEGRDKQLSGSVLLSCPDGPMPLGALHSVTFFPEARPRMLLQFEGEIDAEIVQEQVDVVFFDEAAKEAWRSQLSGQLNNSSWRRTYQAPSTATPARGLALWPAAGVGARGA